MSAPLTTYVAVTDAAHRSAYTAQSPCAVYDATSNKTFLAHLGPLRAPYLKEAATDCCAASLMAAGGRLWLTFFVAHGTSHDGTCSDVYVASYDPADGTFRSAAGTSQGTSLTMTADFTATRAHQGDWIGALRTLVDADGTVLTAFTRLDTNVTPSRTRTSVAGFAADA